MNSDVPQADTTTYRSCLLVSPYDVSLQAFTRALHGAGMAVLQRARGERALALARSGDFDLVAWVCDTGGGDAAALRTIAGHGRPLIALVPDRAAENVSEALDAGADTCVSIEADARVIVAQVEAVFRRYGQALMADGSVHRVGCLVIDSRRCEVLRDGARVALAPSEFRIVEFMAINAGRVLQPHEILNAVTDDYHYRRREAAEVFKVYARRIRKKLEPCMEEPSYLVNVRGLGYRLDGGVARPLVAAS